MIGAKRQQTETAVVVPGTAELRPMLGEKELLKIIPLSRTTLYRLERSGKFPRSTYISPNRRFWFLDEVLAWQSTVDQRNPNRGRGKGRRRIVARLT
jgi:prophage regulatory protein